MYVVEVEVMRKLYLMYAEDKFKTGKVTGTIALPKNIKQHKSPFEVSMDLQRSETASRSILATKVKPASKNWIKYKH